MGFDVQVGQTGHAPASAAPRQHVDDTPIIRAAPPEGATVGGASAVGAAGLGAHDNGPHLRSFWNRLFGGPEQVPVDNRQNHIGPHHGLGPMNEGGPVSNMMRATPYLGDYWEALSKTHDAAHFQGAMNPITAITNVGIPGPLMGLVDAPFRLFGKSLFLDR